MTRPLLILLAALALSACDRLRVDPFDSQLAISDPDLDVVLLEPDLTLRFDTASPLAGATVAIDGREVERDTVGGGFVYSTTLVPGLNALHVEITDEAGEVTRDTLYALHLPIQFSGSLGVSSANTRRVGAAAVALDNTRVLITGGVGTSGTALATGTVLTVFGTQVSASEVSLQEARTGHTATRLPDGRVLLLGGVRTPTTPSAADFVGSAEVLSPDGLSATRLIADIERSNHTTRVLQLEGRTYVYLVGGIVPAGSGVAPSRTVDIFEYVPGLTATLSRLTPPGGASVDGLEAVTDATQIPTSVQESVLFGLTDDDEGLARQLVWRAPGSAYPFSFSTRAAASLSTPRTAAAGVSLAPRYNQLGLLLGGQSAGGQPLRSLEVYAADIDRTFRFPDGSDPDAPAAVLAASRFGHTATILGAGRIVIAGGRGDANVPLASLEILQL